KLLWILVILFQFSFVQAQTNSKKEYKMELTPEQKAQVDAMLKQKEKEAAASKKKVYEYKLTAEEKKKVDEILSKDANDESEEAEEVVHEDGSRNEESAEEVRKTYITLGLGLGYGRTEYEAD